MNNISKNTYNLLKSGLDACVTRGEVISNNITNVNTKNYKRFEVVFEENLKSNNSGLALQKESSGHIGNSNNLQQSETKVVRDTDGAVNSNGNNVNLDMELLNLTANKLKYDSIVTEVNSRLKMSESVIKGGR